MDNKVKTKQTIKNDLEEEQEVYFVLEGKYG